MAARNDKPPFDEILVAQNTRGVEKAIADEKAALKAIARHRVLSAFSASKSAFDALDDVSKSIDAHDHSDDPDVSSQAATATQLDRDSVNELNAARTEKEPAEQNDLDSAKKKLTQAIPLKKKILVYFESYTPPASTTTTGAPSAGPLTVCVYVTNNGSTSTENVHIRDPGAGGWRGTVMFVGQGLSQTNQVTIGSDGSVITPFTVSQFGMATINTSINTPSGTPQTNTTTFTLDTDNDKTTSDCP